MPPPTSPPPSRPLYALTLRLLSMLAVSIMFASVKWLSEHGVNIVESLFYRQLWGMPIALAGVMMGPGLAALKTRHLGGHVSRATLGSMGMVLNFGGYILLPLAEATTIGFSMPIFATLLSVMLLRERPGIHRWAAVIMGFLGVLVIVGPGHHAGVTTLGIIVAVSAAVVTACISLLLRQLSQKEHSSVIVFYFTLLPLPFLGLAMLWFGQAHDAATWAMLIVLGTMGGIAQLLMTAALRWGPVSLVLPMDYSSLLWSTLLGWLVWQTWPGNSTWAGAAIIAGSSLYILWRERVKHRESIDREVTVP
ncbi:DMT family transporter [Sphingobium sp. DEHP117]|uniref:DMT family transporter n=1 Tax=Sphingobium sp. DEHP117 TaxID=2993436 RepID=UPI0027D51BCC|nr:EamA family transporter [Sphingobium sp. DEHP117]MDQ4421310.1 DMT family transporter [Sphingobium sp. DEHP117]